VSAQGPVSPKQSPDAGTISTTSSPDTDDSIQERIEAIYAQIESLNDVQVAVAEGVVTLTGDTSNNTQADRAVGLAARLSGVVTVEDRIERILDLEGNLSPMVKNFEATLSRWSRALPLLLLSLTIFILIAYGGHRLAEWTTIWRKMAPNQFLAELLAQTFRIAAIATGLVIALNLFGASTLTSTILGGAGVLGIAIGFAVRDTLENYIASIMLSLRQPFRANDHVLINEHEGKVARLTSRATVLLTLDGNHLRIPNSTVFKGVILNYTRNPERRFDFELGVDAEDDPMAALKTGVDAIAGLEFVKSDPGPDGYITTVGDSNIVLTYTGWVDQVTTDFLKARSLAIRAAKNALEDSGFTIPEPIYRLRIDSAGVASAIAAPAEKSASDDATDSRKHPQTSSLNENHGVMDIRPEDHLAERVNEERASEAESDLLDESRPSE
jgi:small-conductance mechanosensitive channel